MKKSEKLLMGLGGIDDSLIEEATPLGRQARRRPWVRWGALAVACVLILSLGVWLFIPYDTTPPNAEEYKASPYYSVIAALMEYNYDPPVNDNRFEDLFQDINGALDIMAGAGSASPDADYAGSAGEGSGGAVGVTDNQVAGVEEADVLKRTDTHAFYLDSNSIAAFTIDGEASKQVSRLVLSEAFREGGIELSDVSGREMFLSKDGRRVTVIAVCLEKGARSSVTGLLSLDVGDPMSPRVLSCITVSGSYTDARVSDGELLLFTEYYAPYSPDYSNPESFIPAVNTGEGAEVISPDCVICPDTLSSRRYTVAVLLDEESLSSEGAYAFLSYTENLYVSLSSVYLTRSYTDRISTPREDIPDGCDYTSRSMTEVSRLSWGDGALEYLGSVSVEGSVKNQYAMDEHGDALRIVTSTEMSVSKNYLYNSKTDTYTVNDGAVYVDSTHRSVNLYVIDKESLATVGKVVGFAPEGESAESVRFDGEHAYVCTAEIVTVTDPVFFFDLSDPQSITYTDTGKIDGYSTSLVQLGEGFLLGIGTESGDDLKLEVYEERDGRVVSVSSYTVEYCQFPEEYKCYYIDRESWLFGVPVNTSDTEDIADMAAIGYYEGYMLFRFDGYELTLYEAAEMIGTQLDGRRGFVDGGFLYVVSSSRIVAEALG